MAEALTAFLPRLLLAAGVLLLFLTAWIVLPPLDRRLLPLTVGAPEVSHWLLLCGAALGVAAAITSPRGAIGSATIGLAVVAMAMAAVPLARVPFAIRRFDDGMRAALGPNALERQSGMRPAPVVLSELLGGVKPGNARLVRGIAFAVHGGETLTLDVYRPVAAGRHPTVVQIYGGGWQRGEPRDHATSATALASYGFIVFAIDYRHAPRWQWPAQIEDVRAALAWIRAHGAEYDADISRIALIGRSAGAQLAMVAAYEPSALPIAAVVNLYGAVDLVDGYRQPPVPDPLDVRSILRDFLGGSPEQAPDRYRTASPVSYATRRQPPTLMIYGARDHVVLPRFGVALAERLRAAGGTAVFLEIPWAEHGFDAVPNGPSGQLSLYYTQRFLSWAFDRPAGPP